MEESPAMRRAVYFVGLAWVCAGCGADVDGLFGTAGQGEGGGGGARSGAQQSVGSTSTPTSAQATTGVTTNGATTAVTSGPATTTSGPQTATVTTGPDPSSLVDCGDAGACSVEGDGICCWYDEAKSGECQPNDEQCQSSAGTSLTAIECQLPDQCPGEVCCAHRLFPSTQSPYDATYCTNLCVAPDRVVCDPVNPVCDPGLTCKASTLLPPGYHICTF